MHKKYATGNDPVYQYRFCKLINSLKASTVVCKTYRETKEYFSNQITVAVKNTAKRKGRCSIYMAFKKFITHVYKACEFMGQYLSVIIRFSESFCWEFVFIHCIGNIGTNIDNQI